MIQRYIYNALTEGIAKIIARPAILDLLFLEDYELPAAELAAIKQLWETKTPGVIHSYPRTDTTFPVYAIVLADEREDQTYIGNVAGQVIDPDDPDYGADLESAIWAHQYHIYVVSEHPDVTLYYYEIAKSIILATDWENQGIFSIQVSGADLAPDPKYEPEHMFIRILTFGCSREFMRMDLESKFAKAFRVAGIHVDSEGSSFDVGDVKTLLGTYTIGDEE